ncbi:MAG: DMT family transporter [Paracoccaceae bacterium]|nr:DMT family transporter [Paracoccaceae bacterium]
MTISPRWAYLAVFIGVVGHASSEFFAVLTGVFGPEVSVWRFTIGGLGLILWALARADSRDLITPLADGGWRLAALTFVGVTLPYLAFHWSLDYASIIQIATFITTMPIWVGLTNLWVNKQPFTTVKTVTGAMAMAGIVLLLTDGALELLEGDGSSLIGIGLVTLCAVLGSAYAVMIKPVVNKHGALRTTAVTMTMGGVGLWLTVGGAFGVWVDPATIFSRPASEISLGINPGWWLLVLGLWNTTITQLLWFGGLAAAPDITRASYLFFLKPVIATVLAIFVLSQHPSALQALAILVVVGSVFVEMFWPRIERRLGRTAV